ncbi:MAG: hypothetical protein JNN07_18370 [Verrucomicrobiales bacterium]|jgi:transcriptional regulator with XRE-family HTH domain|nr:hypothetical protein [Verrucomicrobiales bacterium]
MSRNINGINDKGHTKPQGDDHKPRDRSRNALPMTDASKRIRAIVMAVDWPVKDLALRVGLAEHELLPIYQGNSMLDQDLIERLRLAIAAQFKDWMEELCWRQVRAAKELCVSRMYLNSVANARDLPSPTLFKFMNTLVELKRTADDPSGELRKPIISLLSALQLLDVERRKSAIDKLTSLVGDLVRSK